MRLEFVLIILMMGFVGAGVEICIDLDDPSAPLNLGVSGSVGSILLEWGVAVDEPSCSGIDEYVISRDGVEIGRVDGDVFAPNGYDPAGPSFVDGDSLGAGEYTYSVYAVDLVGRNTGMAIKNVVEVEDGGSGGTSGGSSSSSYVCVENWSCGEWSECVGNEQRRLCDDLNECGTVSSKPEVYQECGLMSRDDDMVLENSEEDADIGGIGEFFSAITGAVVGGGAASVAAAGVFLALVLGGLLLIRVRKKR